VVDGGVYRSRRLVSNASKRLIREFLRKEETMDMKAKCLAAADTLLKDGPNDDLNPAYALAGLLMQMCPKLELDEAVVEKFAARAAEMMKAD
jgi:hypothetical protein